jgi:hypothetical protein
MATFEAQQESLQSAGLGLPILPVQTNVTSAHSKPSGPAINRHRLIETVFQDDGLRSRLAAELKRNLARAEAGSGKRKAGLARTQKVADSHNDLSKELTLQFKDKISRGGRKAPDLNNFGPGATAEQARSALKDLSGKCDVVCSNWKKSGAHDDDPDQRPVGNFTNQTTVLHFHHWVQLHR